VSPTVHRAGSPWFVVFPDDHGPPHVDAGLLDHFVSVGKKR
jgi:hypothetical protein